MTKRVAAIRLDPDDFDRILKATQKLDPSVKPGPLPDYVLRAMRGEEEEAADE